MIPLPPLSPREIARFDQDWAQVQGKLNDLLSAYLGVLDESRLPREVDIMGLTHFLTEITSRESCAEILACAMDWIVRVHGCLRG